MQVNDRRSLPNGQLSLTAFGLGCSAIAGLYRPTSEADALQTLAAAWQAGLRYFDTAPFYGFTRGERRMGAFLSQQPRDEFVLSTKVGRLMHPDARVVPGAQGWADPLPFRPSFDYSYGAIMRSVEDSLQRLGLARIDILFVHDIGRATHGEHHALHWNALTQGGGFRALQELRQDGRVAAVGLGVNEWEVVHDSMQEAQLDCTLLAGRYTLLEQRCLHPFLDECLRHGNGIVIGGPFNSGILAGSTKFNYNDAPPEIVQRVQALQAVCTEFEVPLPAAALQFPMAHPAVVSCVAGAGQPAHLLQTVDWFQQNIPSALWQALRERGLIDPSAPCPGDTAAMSPGAA